MSSTSLVKGEDAAADIGSKLLLLGALIFIIGLLIAALGGFGAVMGMLGSGAPAVAPTAADAAAATVPAAAPAPASPPLWLFGLIGMAIGCVISLLAGFILSRSHSDEA